MRHSPPDEENENHQDHRSRRPPCLPSLSRGIGRARASAKDSPPLLDHPCDGASAHGHVSRCTHGPSSQHQCPHPDRLRQWRRFALRMATQFYTRPHGHRKLCSEQRKCPSLRNVDHTQYRLQVHEITQCHSDRISSILGSVDQERPSGRFGLLSENRGASNPLCAVA